MFLEVAILDVRPGQGHLFESAFEEARKIIANSPGCRRHELHLSADRAGRYILLVWWDSIESHTIGFRESSEYQEWKRLLHHFYDPFPHVEHYRLPEVAATRRPLWIMIAGPYRSGSTDPGTWAKNLGQMNAAALEVFRNGHVPLIGVNMALPVIGKAGEASYDSIMMPLSLSLAERCDAILRIGGPSRGADEEVESFRRRGLPVFKSIDEIPYVQ
jgi:heme-degrading monooxygenase HmoA